jgi:hypothetical protein
MEQPASLRIPAALQPVNAMMVPVLTAQGAPEKVMKAWFDFVQSVADWEDSKNGTDAGANSSAATSGS